MDPQWISLFASAGGALASILASSKMRSVLRAVFRRPRETSSIVQVGGIRLDFRGSPTPEQVQRLMDEFMPELLKEQPKHDGHNEHATVTKGEADE